MKAGLFGPAVPEGFAYRADFVTVAEERDLVSAIERLDFSEVVMRGVVARRRTAHFGWTYEYYARRTEPGPPLPDFLLPLRARCSAWAGIEADLFVEALVTEYSRARRSAGIATRRCSAKRSLVCRSSPGAA